MTTDKLENELDELISGGYNYMHNSSELESLLDKLEDAVIIIKRHIRDEEKYR